MIEKLLLASILTFSFSLFTDMGLYSSTYKLAKTTSHHQEAFTLTQRRQTNDKSVLEADTVVD
ncbi:hypothetical protein [Anabaena catenula]|uniref:Uncharacterized protein n=1 Tax=Anabaena catenula FACHB-362 TaxID=2692877 RepID=A0ABR8JAW8_9NOST|nr:hypothetical protein [Anabaena catenula]MBD2694549.1 hypothetical protein [Anabaena catenula FACHB-362]